MSNDDIRLEIERMTGYGIKVLSPADVVRARQAIELGRIATALERIAAAQEAANKQQRGAL